MAEPKKKLPVADAAKGKAAKAKAGGLAAFTDGGTAPKWVTAARVVMLIAFAATIPTILNVKHGNRLTWTVAIASLPFFWMVFGYHVWRRICPLAVMGQVGRLLGKPGTRKMGDWIGKHYILVQLGFMIVALSLRLVATNGSDVWLAGFLGAMILFAIVTSFVYAGKTWCNFLCPVGLVEKIYTEPAQATAHKSDLTSQCAPCVACKKHCPDIDLEQGYWKEATGSEGKPRRIAYYAWPGIVVAFYTYYFLVAGDWSYYFSGAWTYERDLPSHMFDPGFTFAPEIPRIAAAPLTLIVFGAASFMLFALVEKIIASRALKALPPEADPAAAETARENTHARVRHGMLAFCGLVAFNAFYLFAGQPSLAKLPAWVVTGWGLVVVFASTSMFVRRITRKEDQYVHEKFAQKILKKWEWGDAPPSDKLEDIYLLHTERTKQREARLRAYKETVREMVADGLVTRNELVILDSLRAQLGVSDKDHQKVINELSSEERQLFDPKYQGSVEQRLKGEQYRKDLERIVVEAARSGTKPAATTLEALRTERGVTDEEEAAELERILAPGGPIASLYDAEIAETVRLVAAAEASNHPGSSQDSATLGLLRHVAKLRAHQHAINALGVLAVMTKRPEVEHVRAQAAVLLSRFDDEDSRRQLTAMLDDPDPIVREAAVRAMGAKSRLTRDLLTKILNDPDPVVRSAAVRAVSGGTSSDAELPALDPSLFAQTKHGVGKPGVYATLDANATMSQLTTIEKMMLIRQVPIFADLKPEDLEELAGVVEERRIDQGKDVFREGDPGDAVYLIVKGTVRIFTGGDGERPERVLSELGPGACIGEMAVLDASPRSATVRALERTRTLRVPGEGFKRVMSERPEMSQAIVAELVKRMRGMMAQGPTPQVSSAAIVIPKPDR